MNRVIIKGNLGADPELKYANNETPVCNLSVATNSTRKNANGEDEKQTEWHRVVTFGATAINCSKYLQKGRSVYVEGRLQTSKWTDKDGNPRYTTNIIASSVEFIGTAGRLSPPGVLYPRRDIMNSCRGKLERLRTTDKSIEDKCYFSAADEEDFIFSSETLRPALRCSSPKGGRS